MKLARDSWLLVAVPAGFLLVGAWWIVASDSPANDHKGAVRFSLSDGERTDAATSADRLAMGGRTSPSNGEDASLFVDKEAAAVAPSETTKPGDQSPWGIWSGKVLSRDGTPIEGATVTVKGRRNLRLGDDSFLDDSETIIATAGKDGAITFEMKPGFLYELAVRAAGFGLEVFDVRGQAGQDLVLDRASALVGYVMVDGPGGTRIPLAGASVTFQNGREFYTYTTDADGRYFFEGVGAHPAHVQVTDNRFIAQMQSIDSLRPGESSTLNLFLQAGLRLSGEVVSEFMAPVAGLGVTLVDRLTHQVVSYGTTDALGRFLFFSLIPMREYLIQVSGFGYMAVYPTQAFGAGQSVTVTVVPTWLLKVRLNIASGAAAGVRVRLSRQDGLPIGSQSALTAYSNGQGFVAFGDLARELAYRVVIDHPGYATMDLGPVLSAAGQEQTLPVDLMPGRALGGHVVDEDGHPVPFVTIRAQRVDGFPAPPLFTLADSTGAFMFDRLAPGTVSLVTFKSNYDNTHVVVDVPASGPPQSVDLMVMALASTGDGNSLTPGW